MAHPLRASRRSGRRGATLVEALIVLTFFGVVGSLVTLAVSANARSKAKAALGFGARPAAPPSAAQLSERARASSEVGALVLRGAALRWLEGRAESACPAVGDLAGDAHFDATIGGNDAWGNPFELSCAGEEVYVSSAGPDRVRGTGDDVVVGAATGGGHASTSSSPAH